MTRITSKLVPLGALLLAAGCPDETVDCTTEARSSVQIEVVDLDGNVIEDAVATYSVDGGATEDCEAMGGGTLVCGWEQSGDFVIDVDADGYAMEQLTTTVGADECHVITEMLTAELDYVACTDEEVPSVEVTVTDSSGADVTSATVEWNMADEDDLPEACETVGGNVWFCGAEVSGDIRIDIPAAGPYQAFTEVVTVEADECHVITEEVDAVLQFLPD